MQYSPIIAFKLHEHCEVTKHTHISKNILMKKLSFCKHFIIPQMKHFNPLQATSSQKTFET